MKYILGLGNPESKYNGTRHNIGRDIVRALAAEAIWEFDRYANAQLARITLAGEPVTLVLPETYMNKSGETARYVVEKLGATPADLLVVHDEVDVPLGAVKISVGRNAGGNNGVQSIIDQLGSKAFVRVRVGIAQVGWFGAAAQRPPAAALPRFVLGKFSLFERSGVTQAETVTRAAITTIVTAGVTAAMNTYN